MDTEVKHQVREIFKNLREKQPTIGSRKSDRVDIDRMIRDYESIDAALKEN